MRLHPNLHPQRSLSEFLSTSVQAGMAPAYFSSSYDNALSQLRWGLAGAGGGKEVVFWGGEGCFYSMNVNIDNIKLWSVFVHINGDFNVLL